MTNLFLYILDLLVINFVSSGSELGYSQPTVILRTINQLLIKLHKIFSGS